MRSVSRSRSPSPSRLRDLLRDTRSRSPPAENARWSRNGDSRTHQSRRHATGNDDYHTNKPDSSSSSGVARAFPTAAPDAWYDGDAYSGRGHERTHAPTSERESSSSSSQARYCGPGAWKCDWVCTVVGCGVHNFGRRDECFACASPRRVCGVPVEHETGASEAAACAVGLAITPPVSIPTISGVGVCNSGSHLVQLPYTFESGTVRVVQAASGSSSGTVVSYAHVPSPVLLVRYLSAATTLADVS